ncbi:barstar family protein [Streptomyces virginiae]|uniref:barstar family protein n=1 Tax=Streptomyces virginiae TaxID=1961 RepID=UPI003664C751
MLRLHGEELHEKGCMFRAFARELGFPGYFGHNWNALVDCLGDWHGPGHGKQDVAVLIDGADTLLDVEFLGVLVSVLCDGAWRANFMVDLDGEPHAYGSPSPSTSSSSSTTSHPPISPRPPPRTRTCPRPWWTAGCSSP